MPLVNFIALDEEYNNVYDPPVPASKCLPNWHSHMEPYVDGIRQFGPTGNVNATAKRCTSVIDSLIMGYIFTLPCDINVVVNEDGTHFCQWQSALNQHITCFDKRQSQGAGIDPNIYDETVFKFDFRWLVRTPPGYSCMVVHPMWRDIEGFYTLPGVVDTDTYTDGFSFPFLFKKDFEGIIPCGTPVGQIIPFLREEWEHTFSIDNGEHKIALQKGLRYLENDYNKHQHSNKVWK